MKCQRIEAKYFLPSNIKLSYDFYDNYDQTIH